MTTYRVLPTAGYFAVYRQGFLTGLHGSEIEAARMARLQAAAECTRSGVATEVLVHAPGRIDRIARFEPGTEGGCPLPIVKVGDELVALR